MPESPPGISAERVLWHKHIWHRVSASCVHFLCFHLLNVICIRYWSQSSLSLSIYFSLPLSHSDICLSTADCAWFWSGFLCFSTIKFLLFAKFFHIAANAENCNHCKFLLTFFVHSLQLAYESYIYLGMHRHKSSLPTINEVLKIEGIRRYILTEPASAFLACWRRAQPSARAATAAAANKLSEELDTNSYRQPECGKDKTVLALPTQPLLSCQRLVRDLKVVCRAALALAFDCISQDMQISLSVRLTPSQPLSLSDSHALSLCSWWNDLKCWHSLPQVLCFKKLAHKLQQAATQPPFRPAN